MTLLSLPAVPLDPGLGPNAALFPEELDHRDTEWRDGSHCVTPSSSRPAGSAGAS